MTTEHATTPFDGAHDLGRLLEHRAWVRALVRRLVADEARADDVEQQVWLTALRGGAAGVERPRGWLATVARNWARKLHRADARRTGHESAASRPEVAAAGCDALERAEAHRAVVDVVLALPEALRTTVLLHYFDGLTVEETARRTAAPVETVRTRLRRARDAMRVRLAPAHGPAGPRWSAALLAVADLPADWAAQGSTAGAAAGITGFASAAAGGGGVAMAVGAKTAIGLTAAAAAGVAWFAARATEEPGVPVHEAAALRARADAAERERDAAVAALRAERAPRSGTGTARAAPPHDTGRSAGAGGGADRAPRGTAGGGTAGGGTAGGGTAGGGTAGGGTAGGGTGGPSEATPPDHLSAAVRSDLTRLTECAAGSEEHRAIVARLVDRLVAIESTAKERAADEGRTAPPSAATRVIEEALRMEARRDRVSRDEADAAAAVFDSLPAGHGARPGAAAVWVGGLPRDGTLSAQLARLDPNAEPGVHDVLLTTLDDAPSRAFTEYLIRRIRETRDPGELKRTVDVDRVEAARGIADLLPELRAALDARVRDGALSAPYRVRVAGGLAVAWLADPSSGAAALRDAASAAPTVEAAEAIRAVADHLAGGSATSKSIEKLVKR